MYYYYHRWYDPSIGRFISPDPKPGSLSNPQSLNLYVYVVDDPLDHSDPSGEGWFDAVVSFFSPVVNTVTQIGSAAVAVTTSFVNTVVTTTTTVVNTVKGVVNTVVSDAKTVVNTIVTDAKNIGAAVESDVKGDFNALGNVGPSLWRGSDNQFGGGNNRLGGPIRTGGQGNAPNQGIGGLIDSIEKFSDQIPSCWQAVVGASLIAFAVGSAIGLLVAAPETGGVSLVFAFLIADELVTFGVAGAYLLARGLHRMSEGTVPCWTSQ